MNVYNITIPIYADNEQEAKEAQNALFNFVDKYREKNVAVTGIKVATALKKLESNAFVKSQIDNYLMK
ncbi:hypothetical protein [Parabacteroides goldsteinii]|uniref:hypothetical protein n=1 Tax=Parabacteroides goldsteinii TaxID=328812 RepID=UPI0026740889|nr:hypothetical protein [Parabacteroides goldsteinii]